MPKPKDELAVGWAALQRARLYIKKHYPFFYAISLGLIPRYDKDLGTLGVTQGMVLYIDLIWYATLPVEEGAGCIIHEDMHVLRDLRRLDRFEIFKLANLAFDIPINDDLKKFNVKLPSSAVYSDTFKVPPGLSGEKYYELLLPRCKVVTIALPNGKNGQGIEIDGQVYGDKVGAGSCGGCAGAEQRKDKEIDKQEGRSKIEVQRFRMDGLRELKEHLTKSGRGLTPGAFSELLDFTEREPAIVPWQTTISTTAMQAASRIKTGQSDYSLRRPAKRSYTLGIPRPGLIAHDIVTVFIEDTSGSMRSQQMMKARIEFANAMIKLGLTDVYLMSADSAVQMEPRRINVRDLLTLPVIGRGGTYFKPAIDRAMLIRPRPNFIAYSTDGDGGDPGPKPKGVEFIWLLIPGPWTKRPCDWGKQILVSNDPRAQETFRREGLNQEHDDDDDEYDIADQSP